MVVTLVDVILIGIQNGSLRKLNRMWAILLNIIWYVQMRNWKRTSQPRHQLWWIVNHLHNKMKCIDCLVTWGCGGHSTSQQTGPMTMVNQEKTERQWNQSYLLYCAGYYHSLSQNILLALTRTSPELDCCYSPVHGITSRFSQRLAGHAQRSVNIIL